MRSEMVDVFLYAADNISRNADGKIAEYGSHDELAGIPGGIYAKMFEAQAQYYK